MAAWDEQGRRGQRYTLRDFVPLFVLVVVCVLVVVFNFKLREVMP